MNLGPDYHTVIQAASLTALDDPHMLGTVILGRCLPRPAVF